MIYRTLIMAVTLTLFSISAVQADEIKARNLILSQGCKGCHTFEGDGGNLGPALDQVGSRLNATQIEQKLLKSKTANPDSLMPSFKHLKSGELESLINFLASRK